MYGIYNAETLEQLINTVHHIHNTASSNENYLWDTEAQQHFYHYLQMHKCARAQLISQHVDAGQLNVSLQQQPITLSLTKVMLN